MAEPKKRKPKEVGEEFLEGVLKLIPEDKRAAAKELLGSNEQVLEHAGQHVMMRDDYSRSWDKVVEYKGQLDGWYQEKLSTLEEAEKLKKRVAELEKGGGSQPPKDDDGDGGEGVAGSATLKRLEASLKDTITRDEATKALSQTAAQLQQDTLSYAQALNDLSFQHWTDFNERLNTTELIESARKNRTTLGAAYTELTRDRYQSKAKKDDEDRIKKIIDDTRKKVMEEVRSAPPYPIASAEPSTLTGLQPKGDKATEGEFGVAAAVRDYYARNQG